MLNSLWLLKSSWKDVPLDNSMGHVVQWTVCDTLDADDLLAKLLVTFDDDPMVEYFLTLKQECQSSSSKSPNTFETHGDLVDDPGDTALVNVHQRELELGQCVLDRGFTLGIRIALHALQVHGGGVVRWQRHVHAHLVLRTKHLVGCCWGEKRETFCLVKNELILL